MLFSHRQILTSAFERAIQAIAEQYGYAQATPTVQLDVPKDPQHGEAACNIAMQLAKPMRSNPRTLAQQLTEVLSLDESLKDLAYAFEVAGPGFINIRLTHAAKVQVVLDVRGLGAQYGHSTRYAGQKVMLEFVSANPTGPLHVGHGRQAALGDALAAVMQTQGWQVHREFYYNDAGVQIETLAKSVQARLQHVKPGDADWPESAYNGEYIKDIADDYSAGITVQAADGKPVMGLYGQVDTDINNGGGFSGGGGFSTKYGDSPNSDMQAIREFAVAYLRHEQDLDLKAFGVAFDRFYLESSLYTEGKVDAAVKAMVASNHTYEHEGALWLRTTTMGDDKDRVMRKSDGTYTYFVPDVAYHITKFQRGFTKVINIQGTDHHGTIARVRAGLQAVDVGIPQGYPDYVLHKMVTVIKNGAEVKISKRAGSYVTLRDLIAWSGGADENKSLHEQPEALQKGRDAVRFFLISRKADTEFVFDVDLALAQSDENPVYYVQYAHARIQSIIRQAEAGHEDVNGADLSLLQAPSELALMRSLAEYGDVLTKAADELAPHHIAFYLRELSALFHAFYNAERVRVDDVQLKLARVALLEAVAVVLRSGLSVLGVSAPNAM